MATSKIINEFLISLPFNLNVLIRWIPYLGYYIIGHYIVHYALDKIVVFSGLSVVGLLASTEGKYLEILWNPDGIVFFYSTNYFSVPIIILAIGVFGLIACLTQSISEDSRLVRICRFLAPTTFGIYLVHVILLKGIHKLFSIQYPSDLPTALLHEAGLSLASIFLVYAIGLIPFLRSVVSFNTQQLLADYKPDRQPTRMHELHG